MSRERHVLADGQATWTKQLRVLQVRATAEISPGISTGVPPWINRLFTGLLIYVLVCGAWMLTGLGGERVRYYVGLLGDSPACLAALIVTIAATRRMEHGTTRTAWRCLSIALGIYFVGTSIGVNSGCTARIPSRVPPTSATSRSIRSFSRP